ncbi:CaiB/BaiF CoA transferase family protein [Paraburkholderia bannensis]|uniref:CaiB/BaiF CoA transferase family protein n=1 Tax=Paraburkholderia bannensis TaxID=765414 RepID=UPI002ABDAC1E|nr:CaiB/BaiF CoA-transferase family protein [Paraburkholderia bannensis]
MTGALTGLRVLEFAGLGPAPFCSMLLADHGADVLRIVRPRCDGETVEDTLTRGRRTLELDLRQPGATDTVLDLVSRADVLIEGFRPGVMERLGLGPQPCLARRPTLIYGRMTGWGQHGPLAQAAGHDINYLALTGALHAIGRPGEAPAPPLNLVADFGGGAMLLAFGLMAALFEVRRSGRGQVVDAAMTDGVILLSTMIHEMKGAGQWSLARGENLLDGGAPFYDTYACADGKYLAVGPIEAKFYRTLMERCGIEDPLFDDQMDRARWPLMKVKLADLFRMCTRDEWCAMLDGADACVTPVLDWEEAPAHPHHRARGAFVEVDGITQPAPAPRFSRTPACAPHSQKRVTLDDALAHWRVTQPADESGVVT